MIAELDENLDVNVPIVPVNGPARSDSLVVFPITFSEDNESRCGCSSSLVTFALSALMNARNESLSFTETGFHSFMFSVPSSSSSNHEDI